MIYAVILCFGALVLAGLGGFILGLRDKNSRIGHLRRRNHDLAGSLAYYKDLAEYNIRMMGGVGQVTKISDPEPEPALSKKEIMKAAAALRKLEKSLEVNND